VNAIHGRDPAELAQFGTLELEKVRTAAGLLMKLMKTDEQGESLIGRTMACFGSNLGNASNHSQRPKVRRGSSHARPVHFRDRSEARPMRCMVVFQSSGLPSDPRGMAGIYRAVSKSSQLIAGR